VLIYKHVFLVAFAALRPEVTDFACELEALVDLAQLVRQHLQRPLGLLLRLHPETSARTDGVFGCMV